MTNKQKRVAKKQFPKVKRNEHTFTMEDYKALPRK